MAARRQHKGVLAVTTSGRSSATLNSIAIVAVLVWGLLVAVRTPANHARQPREVGS
jgi:hypothetical protein